MSIKVPMADEWPPADGQTVEGKQADEAGRGATRRDDARQGSRARGEDCGSHLCASFYLDRFAPTQEAREKESAYVERISGTSRISRAMNPAGVIVALRL